MIDIYIRQKSIYIKVYIVIAYNNHGGGESGETCSLKQAAVGGGQLGEEKLNKNNKKHF